MHIHSARIGAGNTAPTLLEYRHSASQPASKSRPSEGGSSSESYFDRLREATGMRRSPRLRAAAEICELAARLGTVNRRQVVHSLGHQYVEMCLDRALQDLEAAGVLRVLDGQTCGWGGAVYVLERDASRWHRRCRARRAERSRRTRRGAR